MTTREIAITSQDWVPSSCTLPTIEQPIRVAEFDELFASAVESIDRRGPERLAIRLSYEAANAARAARLATLENNCCSFFRFTLTIADGELILEVAVPSPRSVVLDAFEQRVKEKQPN